MIKQDIFRQNSLGTILQYINNEIKKSHKILCCYKYYLGYQKTMDESSPLAMQFKQVDADGDGKLTVDETYQLLKLVGKNIYKGSVTSAAKLLNLDEDVQTNLFTFAQFKQFYQSLENPLKHDIWKAKYKLLGAIQQIKNQTKHKEESTAAPGAKAGPPQDSAPFKGDIQVTVGPVNQNYNSSIHLNLQKTPKAESKPFIKIIFEQSSNQKAKQLETKFKLLQTNIFDLIKSSDPETSEVLDHIHIITNVSDNKLNVFVTSSNQPLTELGTIAASFLDRVLGAQFSAKANLKYEFNLDPTKFLDKQSNYTFYHALTQNYHFKLVWDACNFKQASKQLFKLIEVFNEFKYDKMDPISLGLIGMLHTDICEVNLVFDNAEFQYAEQESKGQILGGLMEINQLLCQEQNSNLGVFQAIDSFENKAYLQASIGDWKANLRINIKDLKQLFKKKPIQQNQQQNYPQPLVEQNLLIQPLEKVSSVKNLSPCSSQNSFQKVKVKAKVLQEKPQSSPKISPKKEQSYNSDSS